MVEKLNKGVDFLFGVLVAVSVEKAIEGFLHVRAHEWFIDPTHPQTAELASVVPGILMFLRLIIFLGLVTTFYIGSSIRYFDSVYSGHEMHGDPFRKRYIVDFFSGLLHFTFFVTLSLSIAVSPGNIEVATCYKLSNSAYRFSSYSIMLMVILLYDTVWLFARKALTSIWQNSEDALWRAKDDNVHHTIYKWAKPNLGMMLLTLILAGLGAEVFPEHLARVEEVALLPVLYYTFRNFSATIKF